MNPAFYLQLSTYMMCQLFFFLLTFLYQIYAASAATLRPKFLNFDQKLWGLFSFQTSEIWLKMPLKIIFWAEVAKICIWVKFYISKEYFHWFRRQKYFTYFGQNLEILYIVARAVSSKRELSVEHLFQLCAEQSLYNLSWTRRIAEERNHWIAASVL